MGLWAYVKRDGEIEAEFTISYVGFLWFREAIAKALDTELGELYIEYMKEKIAMIRLASPLSELFERSVLGCRYVSSLSEEDRNALLDGLLWHCDCEGEIRWDEAKRLVGLLNRLELGEWHDAMYGKDGFMNVLIASMIFKENIVFS